MLATILRSEIATQRAIQIIRGFTLIEKTLGQSALPLYKYIIQEGLADQYLQVIESLLSNQSAGSIQKISDQQTVFFNS